MNMTFIMMFIIHSGVKRERKREYSIGEQNHLIILSVKVRESDSL